MPRNDPVRDVENIIQLPQSRRAVTIARRPQAAPIVAFASWVECRDRAAASLLSGTTRLLLTGPAGTGKTVLLDHVARVLRAAGRSASVKLADTDPAPPSAGETLLVDEADRLSPAKLLALQSAAGTLVLAGLDSLLPRKIPAGTVHLTLAPLGQEAARAFMAEWLALSGRPPADLDSDAVRHLMQLSGGVPRLLSTLLAGASWLAETSNSPTISAEHVEEAAELRSVLMPATLDPAITIGGGKALSLVPPPRRGLGPWSVLLLGGTVAVVAAAIVPRFLPDESERAIGQVTALAGTVETWARTGLASKPAPTVAPAPPKPTAPVPALPVVAETVPPAPDPLPEAPSTVAAEAPPSIPPAVIAAPLAEPAPSPAPEPVHVAESAPPLPLVVAVVPAVSPPAAVPTAKAALSAETIDFLLRRGREMRDLDDLSAARLFFRRAAEDGNPDAMFELGGTFDPANLHGVGAAVQADLAEAMRWYRRAAEAGSSAAARQIVRK